MSEGEGKLMTLKGRGKLISPEKKEIASSSIWKKNAYEKA